MKTNWPLTLVLWALLLAVPVSCAVAVVHAVMET